MRILKTITVACAIGWLSQATFADQAAWEAVHGKCGGGHENCQSYSITADGSNVVTITRTFATEADWDTASAATHSGSDAATYDMAFASDSREG